MPNNNNARPEWTRRLFLTSGIESVAGLALLGRQSLRAPTTHADSSHVCNLDQELTEGPYYLDRGLFRPNITEGKPGIPLKLRTLIVDARSCTPVRDAALEIWHCDASGVYSGFTKMNPGSFGGPSPGGPDEPGGPDRHPLGPPPDGRSDQPPGSGFPGPLRARETDKTSFFRGIQLSGVDGYVEFATIYPGWYVSRDTHIHLKVHLDGLAKSGHFHGGRVVHTGQLFFPDELTDEIGKLPIYAKHRGTRTRLEDDMVFGNVKGTPPILRMEPLKGDSLQSGFLATMTVRVDPSASIAAEGHGPY